MTTETMTSTDTVSIAPTVRDSAHLVAIEHATATLDAAHRAVADAAGEWYDSCRLCGPGDVCGDRDDRQRAEEDRRALRDAVEAWRDAGQALVEAVTGRTRLPAIADALDARLASTRPAPRVEAAVRQAIGDARYLHTHGEHAAARDHLCLAADLLAGTEVPS